MHRIRTTTLAAALAAAVMSTAGPATAADTAVTIGSSGDRISGVAAHVYGKLSGKPVTDAAFVNIETTVAWSRVASGSQDAALRRWADALKGKGTRLVSWSHEPMAKQNVHWGTPASFIASFKHVVAVFDQRGATNVRWVWNATSNSFRIAPSNSGYGAKWYPGDAVVDYVAGESYNRYRCGFSAPKSFGAQIKEILTFARQHGKRFIAAEFASNGYSGRAQWLRDAKAFIAANNLRGAFYFNSTNGSDGCNWKLTSDAERDVVRSMG